MWEKIKFISSEVWTFLLPKIKLLLSKAGPVIIAVAVQAVTKASEAGGTGAEKREIAFSYAKERLTAEGIKIGTSMLNSVLEDAYQAIK